MLVGTAVNKRWVFRLIWLLCLTIALSAYYGYQVWRPKLVDERTTAPGMATRQNLKALVTRWQREWALRPDETETALERALDDAPAAFSSKSEREEMICAFTARIRLEAAVVWLAPLPVYAAGLLLVRWRALRYVGVAVLAASLTLIAASVFRETVVGWLIPAGQSYVSDFVFLGEADLQSPSRDQCVIAFERPPWDHRVAVAFGDGFVTWVPVEEFLALAASQGIRDRIPQ